jgi:hypothetical protein
VDQCIDDNVDEERRSNCLLECLHGFLLKEHFDVRDRRRAAHRLRSLRQGKASLSEHSQVFRQQASICRSLGCPFTECDIIEIFLMSLNDDYKKVSALIQLGARNQLEDVICLLLDYDRYNPLVWASSMGDKNNRRVIAAVQGQAGIESKVPRKIVKLFGLMFK